MSKKTIIIILTAIVAAATAAIELLSSCSTGTIFHRVTPADSVYYERHVDLRPGSLSRIFPFSPLQHNGRERLQKNLLSKDKKRRASLLQHSHVSAIAPQGRSSGARLPRAELSVQLARPIGEAHFLLLTFFSNFNTYTYV